MTKHRIQLDGPTQRFYQGLASANEVIEAHSGTDFPDKETREAFFWFYVGAMAAEKGCTTQEDFGPFLQGASLRQP